MSESNKKISITLTLEGQNFIENMNGATVATKKFNEELPKVPATTKALTGSLDDLNARLRDAHDRFNALTKDSPGYEASLKRIQVLNDHVKNSSAGMNKTLTESRQDLSRFGAASGQTGNAILNMNRVVSDAPWGFIAISNNIEPLFNSMTTLVQQSGSVRVAMLSLGKSMIGPLGLTTAVSLATAALTYYTLHSSRNTAQVEANRAAIESLIEPYKDIRDIIRDLNREIEGMSLDTLDDAFVKLHIKLEELSRTAPRIIDKIWYGLTFKPLTDAMGLGTDSWLLQELQTTPSIFGKPGKDTEGITNTEQAIERIKKHGEAIRKVLTGDLNLEKTEPGKLRLYLQYIDKQLEDWAKGTGEKNISIGNKLNNTFFEIGTFDRAKVEEIKKRLDEYLKPDKKGEKKDELDLYKLRYELNLMSAWDYEDYLKKRLAGAKKGTADELKLYKDLYNELVKLQKLHKPEIKAEFNFETELQEKVFNKIRKDFARMGIIWDGKAQAYALRIALSTYEVKAKLSSIKITGKSPIEKYADQIDLGSEEFDMFRLKAKLVQSAAERTADILVGAFTGVKLTLKEVVAELGTISLRLIAMAGVKYGLAKLFPMLVPLFHGGGVAGAPTQFAFVGANVFDGARRYHSGKDVPAILQSDEVVYTAKQHKGLMNMLTANRSMMQSNSAKNVIVFKNLLDGQKFIQENMKKHTARIR